MSTTYELYIDGEWRPATDNATFESINPYSGEPWATVANAKAADVDAAVKAARAALSGPWGQMTGFQRAALMRKLAEILRRDAVDIAKAETRDNGKLLREMQGQMEYIPSWYEYFAGIADKLEGAVIPSDRPNFLVYTRHEPVGVVAGIVPWNSPLLTTAFKLAPALAAGCTFVLKPSDYTPVSALEFAKRVDEAGFPAGVFNVVTGAGIESSKALAEHPDIDKVAFTGSTKVGIQIAKAAAENHAGALLELGGKSAQIVFDDADLESAANGVIAGIFAATGQTCVAGSRLIVHEDVHDELIERVSARAREIILGDPLEAETEMGPVSNQAQFDTVTGFIERAKADGATVATGGGPDPEKGGLFVQPTILTDVRPEMEVYREEIFGPVLSALKFSTEEEAIALANDNQYGLAAGVWTENVHRAHRVAHKVRAGSVWINAYRLVAPNVPFGGYGASGLGRENGKDSVLEFTETKAVWVELDGATRDPFRLG